MPTCAYTSQAMTRRTRANTSARVSSLTRVVCHEPPLEERGSRLRMPDAPIGAGDAWGCCGAHAKADAASSRKRGRMYADVNLGSAANMK